MTPDQVHEQALIAVRGTLEQAKTTPMDQQMRTDAINLAEHILNALEFYKARNFGVIQ
jgi:hypothetical protein